MRSTIRVGITLAMVVAAIFAGSWIWQHYMYSPWTRDARVRADVVTIAPGRVRLGGRAQGARQPAGQGR